jgi:formylglycine-generating enzyme required for sulfatase activity
VKDLTAADGSEWVIACSNDGKLTYPYGSDPMAGVCVDKKHVASAPGTDGLQPVKAATGCVGGVAGLYDMAGNASEWQNDCVESTATTSDGSSDACDAYGGSVSSDYQDTSCKAAAVSSNTAAHFTRSQVAADNGFRCCADAVFF